MPVFGYRGLAADGRSVSGVIDADSAARPRAASCARWASSPLTSTKKSPFAARRSLRERLPGLRRKMPAADVALLTRQLGSLLGGGVPLLDALTLLSEQAIQAAGQKDDVPDP